MKYLYRTLLFSFSSYQERYFSSLLVLYILFSFRRVDLFANKCHTGEKGNGDACFVIKWHKNTPVLECYSLRNITEED